MFPELPRSAFPLSPRDPRKIVCTSPVSAAELPGLPPVSHFLPRGRVRVAGPGSQQTPHSDPRFRPSCGGPKLRANVSTPAEPTAIGDWHSREGWSVWPQRHPSPALASAEDGDKGKAVQKHLLVHREEKQESQGLPGLSLSALSSRNGSVTLAAAFLPHGARGPALGPRWHALTSCIECFSETGPNWKPSLDLRFVRAPCQQAAQDP
ncbi:hypothetical protein SKAU_G00035630 [Synaphobranchus kaupii]|uniref:Uncharacterized protein n=1 Tax=Synaphobranchus kaupii TaxID=118154 RepID=A0A9Q1JFU7_SYNKA|nr:hypothetical protein SKAU_G00035630 [Synaphobranchus kaupii]